jgi:sulfate/thiosulfate transport system ATP-binding protein
VYRTPATPFVYQFIGDVNVFHGRLEDGRLRLEDGGGTVGVRPHELSIETSASTGDGFHAKVVHINAAGSVVKVQLQAPWGDLVRVEMSQDRYRSLALERHAEVFVRVTASNLYVTPSGTVRADSRTEVAR